MVVMDGSICEVLATFGLGRTFSGRGRERVDGGERESLKIMECVVQYTHTHMHTYKISS